MLDLIPVLFTHGSMTTRMFILPTDYDTLPCGVVKHDDGPRFIRFRVVLSHGPVYLIDIDMYRLGYTTYDEAEVAALKIIKPSDLHEGYVVSIEHRKMP